MYDGAQSHIFRSFPSVVCQEGSQCSQNDAIHKEERGGGAQLQPQAIQLALVYNRFLAPPPSPLKRQISARN